jgi:hypothetical protein
LFGLAAFTSKVSHLPIVEAWEVASGKLLWRPDRILLWRWSRSTVELLLLLLPLLLLELPLLELQVIALILLLLRSEQLTHRWDIHHAVLERSTARTTTGDDPGIIVFIFFSSASPTAFISLSWLMAALANSLYDRLVNIPRCSCKLMVSPTQYKLAFFSSVSMWYDPYWARVLNYLVYSNTLWFPCSRSRNSFSFVWSGPVDK